ncbi:MAG TPA: DUF4097 family beta strand repeat-containing protein [Longimicrobiales bacterium]|nr:DUF4097 family beta strand repeat-containing protein [Longimicrobiales bacterium]
MSSLALAAALLVTVQAPDTVIDARRGDRVVIELVTGDVAISAWERDAVEVRASSGGGPVGLRRSGSAIQVVPSESRGRARSVDATLRVPRWIDLEIGSRSLDLSVTGTAGAIRVGNVSGDVRIQDVAGPVEVRSIRGEIEIIDARGGVRASSQGDDVVLTRVSGSVEAHSGDGDIVLQDVRSEAVRVEAQDGDVSFSGTIAPGGDYGFYVHDGDATIAVPAETSAQVSVSTFDGEFQSDFTVRVESFTSGRGFDFMLGDGSARIRIEVFDGEIRLLRSR